jgi:prepilin-type N-terminal cleavage/methylation domain-containing protein
MNTKRRGVSLVELIIVLAISALMVTIAIATFGSRKRVVADDAAKQLESIYQTARNEAQQGLGPTNGATFNPGETLFGQAIQFRNNCTGTTSCITVYKLKQNGTTVSSYESYDVNLREGLRFDIGITNPCNSFASCYQPPGASSYQKLDQAPISMNGPQTLTVVIRNGNGGSYAFASVPGVIGLLASDTTNYMGTRQGIVRIATVSPNGYQYYLTLDLSGNNQTSISNP